MQGQGTTNSPVHYRYQVALSFAGEDRPIVSEVARLLQARGVSVFYDEYELAELWGKDLYQRLACIYSKEAQYCLVFISRHYAAKLWTKHELKQAQSRAFRENKEYILPVRLDDTEIVGLPETLGFLDLREHSTAQLVSIVLEKLGQPADINLKGAPEEGAPEDYYFILNRKTGRCLDVEDWGRRTGNPISIQRPYYGGQNQIWFIERHDDQWFKITSAHSRLCLQVVDGRLEDEAPIEQGLFEGLEHQQWSFTKGPPRGYIIRARHSRKVLAVKEDIEGGRVLAVQSTWKDSSDQYWWISREARIDGLVLTP